MRGNGLTGSRLASGVAVPVGVGESTPFVVVVVVVAVDGDDDGDDDNKAGAPFTEQFPEEINIGTLM